MVEFTFVAKPNYAEALFSVVCWQCIQCSVWLTGPHSCGLPWSYCVGSSGKELTGFSTKFHKPDEEGEGEVTARCLIIYA